MIICKALMDSAFLAYVFMEDFLDAFVYLVLELVIQSFVAV